MNRTGFLEAFLANPISARDHRLLISKKHITEVEKASSPSVFIVQKHEIQTLDSGSYSLTRSP